MFLFYCLTYYYSTKIWNDCLAWEDIKSFKGIKLEPVIHSLLQFCSLPTSSQQSKYFHLTVLYGKFKNNFTKEIRFMTFRNWYPFTNLYNSSFFCSKTLSESFSSYIKYLFMSLQEWTVATVILFSMCVNRRPKVQ